MGLTAKRFPNSWFLNRKALQIILLLLVLALLALAWSKWAAPRLSGLGSVSEANMPAIKVVVKNGCGIERLATDYASYLKDKNIDVVSLGDTPHPIYNKSVIEVKDYDRQDLQRLQKMTGIKRFTLAEDSGSEAPFVIIVGADFEEIMN